MSQLNPAPDAREHFTDILDRMQLLRGDFTAHPDDRAVMHALADAPEASPGPAAEALPDEYCGQLALPPGSTYRDGARKLLELLAGEWV